MNFVFQKSQGYESIQQGLKYWKSGIKGNGTFSLAYILSGLSSFILT